MDGRSVGITTGPAGDLESVARVRQAVLDAGMVPLVVAPVGGLLGSGDGAVTVQRTFAAGRSVEFDALLCAGTPSPGSDAYGARDAKRASPSRAPSTLGSRPCSLRPIGTARPSAAGTTPVSSSTPSA